MTTVDHIKANWPIERMLDHCGIPYSPKTKFPAFHRPDANPSCEIYNDHVVDRSTGERFDSIAIYAWYKGITNGEAIKELRPLSPVTNSRPPKPKPEPQKLIIPEFKYSKEEAWKLAEMRCLTPYATETAGVFLGVLSFANVCGYHSWVLSDSSNRIAEGRRMDGELYPAYGDNKARKCHALKGSCKSWPLGMNPRGAKVPATLPVMIVEGGPDYLAACDVLMKSAREFLPVAMLGCGSDISPDALPFFKGRRVLILAHPEDAGQKAAKKWKAQLINAGADARAKQLIGGDLNDLVSKHGAEPLAEEMQHELY